MAKHTREQVVTIRKQADEGDREAQLLLGKLCEAGDGVKAEPKVAAKWFRRAARAGSGEASYRLGLLQLYGNGQKANAAKAMVSFKRARELRWKLDKGVLALCRGRQAEEDIGTFRRTGRSAPTDGKRRDKEDPDPPVGYTLARQHYEEAVEAGNRDAMLRLADLCETGKGGVKDARKATKLRAKAGNAEAKVQLRRQQLADAAAKAGTESAESVDAQHQAAEAGEVHSQYVFGLRLLQGRGIPANPADGIAWLAKAAAAHHAAAMFELGRVAEATEGTPNRLAAAVDWYRQAADLGQPDARCSLAKMMVAGTGVARDPDQAARILGAAARSLHVESKIALEELAKSGNATAAYEMGRTLAAEPYGVGQRKTKTMWYEEGAAKGHPEAMFEVAQEWSQELTSCEKQGLQPADWATALLTFVGTAAGEPSTVRCIRSAAERGSAKALLAMARLYARGDDVPYDPVQANRWRERAAQTLASELDATDPAGLAAVGERLATGDGIEPDPRKALSKLQSAAEAGHLDAIVRLGRYYQIGGPNLTRSPGESADLLRRAGRQGRTDAKLYLAQLLKAKHAQPLNAGEKAESDEILRQYRPLPPMGSPPKRKKSPKASER